MKPSEQEVTEFVNAMGCGQDADLKDVFSAVYAQLRGLAHAQRRQWPGLETLSTTAVVHEAYLKLSQQEELAWHDRGHFLRIAARAMRFILVNYAERSRAAKRGGGNPHVPADEAQLIDPSRAQELLALDEALTRLAQFKPRWAQVVECRAFAGLDVEETAEALDVSARTVKRDWRFAQAWLYNESGG